ncbi:hypothetical protein C0J52_22931 [Blattella germanica]|nr:hypothetical protein C0J52_22931 [Blattella germanica]
MQRYLGLFLLVGLASALTPEVKELPVLGVPGVQGVPGVIVTPGLGNVPGVVGVGAPVGIPSGVSGTQLLLDPLAPLSGLRNVAPTLAPTNLQNPLIQPTNIVASELLRSPLGTLTYLQNPLIQQSNIVPSELLRSPLGTVIPLSPVRPAEPVYDILNKPILLAAKGQSQGEGYSVYILERGISALPENPNTKPIHEIIRTGAQKTALVIYPESLTIGSPVYNLIRTLPVGHLEIPQGIKLGSLARGLNAQVLLVLIIDNEEIHTLGVEGLVRLGNLGVTENDVVYDVRL